LARDGGAYTTIFEEPARLAAGAGHRPAGPLDEAIVAVKDMIAVRGHRRGGGSRSRVQSEFCADDAPVVAALRGAGAVLIGLTALHELAFGVTGINAFTGTPANPAAPGCVPGGSSSGSAVAVATGSADIALGTDTGGSIRIPAALCGVVGYKPERGRFPTDGVLALAATLDHVGVLTASVAQAKVVDRLFGPGNASALGSSRTPGPMRLGVHRAHLAESDPAVRDAVAAAIDRLATAHSIVDVSLPATDEVIEVTNTIMFFEAAQIYGPLADDPHSGLGDDVRTRLESGLRIAPADYERARARARGLRNEVALALALVDAVLEPTVPIAPPTLADAPGLGPRLVAHTRLANLTGLPAISVPLPGAPHPVGLQFTAIQTEALFRCAADVEASVAGAHSGADVGPDAGAGVRSQPTDPTGNP
jgi:Asp-tRNA(Asn)/Glu-tRNA(Gln) amidotransferase A subunit family amidase